MPELLSLYPWQCVFYQDRQYKTPKSTYSDSANSEHFYQESQFIKQPSTYDNNSNNNQFYTGYSNNKNISKIQKSCNIVYHLSPCRVVYNPILDKKINFQNSFITLTLSAKQEISDREITANLLQPFLRHYRQTNEMHHYVWKAERQSCGNIHYHIISDAFITISNLQNYWNKLQSKYDFIDRFAERYDHRKPNSIDVMQIKNRSTMAKYISKYMSKQSDQRINGKIWDCSESVSSFRPLVFEINNHNYQLLNHIINTYNLKRIKSEYYSIAFINKSIYKLLKDNLIWIQKNFVTSWQRLKMDKEQIKLYSCPILRGITSA